MKKIFQKRILLIVLTSGMIIALIWQLSISMVSARPLSEADASKLVRDLYGGEIAAIKKTNDHFYISLQSEIGLYEITIDQKSGEILGIEKKESDKSEQQLTVPEVKQLIKKDYPGKIEQLEKRSENGQLFYFVIVRNGTVETTIKLNPVSGKIVESSKKTDTKEETVHGITKKEAVKIALNQVKGVVEDVDIEESDGLYYYLVEVEQDKEREATIQINSITGEILSITWDD
ncbi:MAG TPA: hypothetical protein DEO65_12340 [Bacillus bacterium]|uniref:PepSY domain-containing protein n=1 Tax=Siminovitchia fordii TaxID=254759 RepID=A0ABQ4K6D3_9BACI|nr:PepSY domain-containing protein [Siminovitchia fordii]GIN21284.1 hypothetical protein J1TS3_24180 [Siminovitchia fordii]HBZ10653.1 hypothetical protein [Bacillus sp. (in: firmicutes)]